MPPPFPPVPRLQHCSPAMLVLMRRSRPSHTQKSLPFVELEAAVVVDEAAAEIVVIGEAEPKPKVDSLSQGGEPSIPTYLQVTSSGAICILNGGKEVTFVLILQAAPGRISPLQSLQNETSTSSAKKK